MVHPLDDCRAKLDRADHHLVDLDERVEAFLDEHVGPDPIGDYDDETGEYVAKVPAVPEIPLIFGVIVGEIVGHLRSSLDHLVYQLVLRNNNIPGGRERFPIFAKSPDYFAHGAGHIIRIAPTAQALIQSLQPYHRGADFQSDPLWKLNKLANTDKHHALTVVMGGALLTALRIQMRKGIAPTNPRMRVRVIPLRPEHETEFLRIAAPFGEPMNVNARVVFHILFDHPAVALNQPVVPFLKRLAQTTRSVVDRFAAEFFCK